MKITTTIKKTTTTNPPVELGDIVLVTSSVGFPSITPDEPEPAMVVMFSPTNGGTILRYLSTERSYVTPLNAQYRHLTDQDSILIEG